MIKDQAEEFLEDIGNANIEDATTMMLLGCGLQFPMIQLVINAANIAQS